MFRPATRVLARAPVATRAPASVRLISSGPAKSRSWKNYILRLGLAGGAVYYYNTSSVFAEQPSFSALSYLKKDDTPEETRTLESITPKIREERAKAQQLENEAGQEAAFNPETGEINWDCPCLGGMAHGPCGEEFKAAFSCFVYSEEEPKGIDCIEKFKGMQDCFRLHPEVYGAELEDDEPEGGAPAPTDAPATDAPATDAPAPTDAPASTDAPVPTEAPAATVDASNVNVEQSTATEGEVLVPKPAHEAEEKNQEVEKAEK